MKKLIVTIAIALCMGMTTFAQEAYTGNDGVTEENGLFGLGVSFFDRDGDFNFFLEYYELDDEEDMNYSNQPQSYVDDGFFGLGIGLFNGNRDGNPGLPGFGDENNQDSPLGSGLAVLVGLGAAYLVGKKRKEE